MPAVLTLASASPRRREILQSLGYTVQQAAADIDETPQPQENAADYVQRMARGWCFKKYADIK